MESDKETGPESLHVILVRLLKHHAFSSVMEGGSLLPPCQGWRELPCHQGGMLPEALLLGPLLVNQISHPQRRGLDCFRPRGNQHFLGWAVGGTKGAVCPDFTLHPQSSRKPRTRPVAGVGEGWKVGLM